MKQPTGHNFYLACSLVIVCMVLLKPIYIQHNNVDFTQGNNNFFSVITLNR